MVAEKIFLPPVFIADAADTFIGRVRVTLQSTGGGTLSIGIASAIECFITHAERQIDQIHRRVILGEKIPHGEKVFSIFEEHTEWISKGKAGVPVELEVYAIWP